MTLKKRSLKQNKLYDPILAPLSPAIPDRWTPTDTQLCVTNLGKRSTFLYKPKAQDLKNKERLLSLQKDVVEKMLSGTWAPPKAGDLLSTSNRKSKIFSLVVTEPKMKHCGKWLFLYFHAMVFRGSGIRKRHKRVALVNIYKKFSVVTGMDPAAFLTSPESVIE